VALGPPQKIPLLQVVEVGVDMPPQKIPLLQVVDVEVWPKQLPNKPELHVIKVLPWPIRSEAEEQAVKVGPQSHPQVEAVGIVVTPGI
jgi:hypothetical protein